MLLAIDTATRNAGVALYNADGVQVEIAWRTRENHTIELTPQIVHAMELAKIEMRDMQAVGVAMGPGSFTGLRVGMSVAKGLSFARNIPVLGVPTLDAIAHAHSLQNLPIYAVLAAGRGRFSVARYDAKEGIARRVGDYALVTAEGLVEFAMSESNPSPLLFCGEIDNAMASLIVQRLGARAIVAPPALNARRAGLLAELAWRRFQRGELDDVALLAPIYAATV